MPITVKVAFGKDLRRVQLPDLRFSTLSTKCRSTFTVDKTKFLYVDNEGDLITIANDAELEEAFQLSKQENKILKLQLENVATPTSAGRTSSSNTSLLTPSSSKLSSNTSPPITVVATSLRDALRGRRDSPFSVSASGSGSGSASGSGSGSETHRESSRRTPYASSGSGSGSDSQHPHPHYSYHSKKHTSGVRSDTGSGSGSDRGSGSGSDRHSSHRGSGPASQSDSWRSSTRSSGVYKAKFIKDLSLPDRTEVLPNQVIIKTWQLLNTGTIQWPMGSAVKLFRSCGGAVTDPNSRFPVPCAKPGEVVDVSAIITTPELPGRCRAFFRLCDLDGRFFGPRMWMDITVVTATTTSEDTSCTTSIDDSDYAEGCDPCFLFDALRVEDEKMKEEAATQERAKNALGPEKKVAPTAMDKDPSARSLADTLSVHGQKFEKMTSKFENMSSSQHTCPPESPR
eukprot:g68086.t1